MKPTAWYDPSNGVVSTDQDCPLFTPLGQVWPLYPKQEDDGVTLPTIRHPRGKPALGDLNPESLETVEIDLPEPIGYVSEGSAERLATNKQAHEQIKNFRLFAHDVPVYTSPPRRTWVGLTLEQYVAINSSCTTVDQAVGSTERQLKENNT
jgi:hypothetical protein